MLGMVPPILLTFKYRSNKFIMFPIALGIVPVNELVFKLNLVTFVSDPIVWGIVPTNLFILNVSSNKFVNNPSVLGIVDVRRIRGKYRYSRLLKLPTEDGNVPSTVGTLNSVKREPIRITLA